MFGHEFIVSYNSFYQTPFINPILFRFVSERKLFVGMLSKKYSENDVRQMFQVFGTIEECTVLRDNSAVSKGKLWTSFLCFLVVSAR
jgi:RNA recognition motif.